MTASNTHQTTHLPSSLFPSLCLRWITPLDGIPFAHLVSSPENNNNNTPPDEAWGHGAVNRMADHAIANPTVTDSSGNVTSGPAKANLFVVEDGEPIGVAGFGCIKTWQRGGRNVRAGDAGVVLRADKRGKGYATEAMKLSLDFGAATVEEGGLQLDLLTVTTLEHNWAMIKVIERLGVSKERGVLRPAEFAKDKQEWYYEIPPEEWREKRCQK